MLNYLYFNIGYLFIYIYIYIYFTRNVIDVYKMEKYKYILIYLY